MITYYCHDYYYYWTVYTYRYIVFNVAFRSCIIDRIFRYRSTRSFSLDKRLVAYLFGAFSLPFFFFFSRWHAKIRGEAVRKRTGLKSKQLIGKTARVRFRFLVLSTCIRFFSSFFVRVRFTFLYFFFFFLLLTLFFHCQFSLFSHLPSQLPHVSILQAIKWVVIGYEWESSNI